MSFPEGTKLLLLAPVHIPEERSVVQTLQLLSQQGYARIRYQGEIVRIDSITSELDHDFQLVVDRIITQTDEDFIHRLADASDTAFFEGKGQCIVEEMESGKQAHFSNSFELDGITFLEPNVHLFSFNNPYGACPKCEGYGDVIGIDEDLVIPNPALSVYENCIFAWRGDSMSWVQGSTCRQCL